MDMSDKPSRRKGRKAGNSPKKPFVSGFVSILGRPNAGKSTLLNALIGSKLAIVSSKPQTTRNSIQGVLHTPDAQVVFVDTPGIHQGELLLHRRMMDSVRNALEHRDLILWVVDASQPFRTSDLDAFAVVREQKAPVFLVLNKIDQLRDRNALLPMLEAYRLATGFEEFLPISALSGEGIDGLRAAIVAALPPGPKYFPEDHYTDQPERQIAAELIRERVLEETRQEVPHAVAVLIDEWKQEGRRLVLSASIVVEREGQKRIVIGKGGDMIRRIGARARQEMEALFGYRIFLDLFVKVRENWRESQTFLDELDLQQRPSDSSPAGLPEVIAPTGDPDRG